MPARIDPFVDVLLREQGEQLYLLPDEPVTMIKDGKSRKVSKQPLTDQIIYALLVEVAPSESADQMDRGAETEFEYVADRGMVRVRIVPELGRLTAVVAPTGKAAAAPVAAAARAPAVHRAPGGAGAAAAHPPPKPPRSSGGGAAPVAEIRAAAPMAEIRAAPPPAPARAAPPPAPAPAAARALGDLLRALVESASSDLHLRVGEPPIFRTHGEMKRRSGPATTAEQLELMLLAIMPERNRAEWKETWDSDFAYEIAGLARFRVNAARDRKGPAAVFRVIPSEVATVERLNVSK